ncbi:MAG: 50S ribosomal protein L22 [Phycisphaerales bacterium]|nr:50S ribosomal protein L22 [Phycisphaerales bacterium]
MAYTSKYNYARISARKVRLVADLIRGKSLDEALSLLSFSKKRAAVMVKKTLDAAVADAELDDADITVLYVSESRVDAGPTLKRWRPKDRGRAHPINKRTSHIIVAVEEAS